MRVSVASGLGEHAAAWDSLVEGMPIPSPFLRSWWVDTAAGAQPCIVLVHEGDRLVGGLALERDRHLAVERLRVLGSGALCPDHLDAVAASDLRREVGAAVGAWLVRSGDRLLDFDGVVSHSIVANSLRGRVRQERSAIAPWVALDKGNLAHRSRNLRGLLKQTERRIVDEAGSCTVVRIDDINASLSVLHRLHADRWGSSSAFLGDFDRFETVARAAAARHELTVEVLRAGKEVVAVDAFFEVAGRISFYQGGRIPDVRWRSAGTLLLARALDGAARRGLREADLLRGDEPYKLRLAPERRDLWRVRCATGPRAALALQIEVAAERGRRVVGTARQRLRAVAGRGRSTGNSAQ